MLYLVIVNLNENRFPLFRNPIKHKKTGLIRTGFYFYKNV